MEKALAGAPTVEGCREASRELTAEDFEELVPAHQRRIYGLLRAITRDPDLASTLTQECFLRAYRRRSRFRWECSIGTWLTRIAINLALDERKNRRRRFWEKLTEFASMKRGKEGRGLEALSDGADAEEALLIRERAREVWRVVEELSPRQRAVFALRFGEGQTIEEIARSAGLEVGTVKAHLYRAIGILRRRLREQEP